MEEKAEYDVENAGVVRWGCPQESSLGKCRYQPRPAVPGNNKKTAEIVGGTKYETLTKHLQH